METIFGDGSAQSEGGGFMGALLGAGKRILTGESLFMTLFGNGAGGRQKVAFAAPYPGSIVPIDLKEHGTILCQKDAFLCAAKGIAVGIAFQKKLGAGLFGGEGFILQKLEGDGLAFAHAGGTVVKRELAAGEKLRVDTGCLVAFDAGVDYDIQIVVGNQDGAVRRRGPVLRDADRTGDDLDAVAAVQPPGEPHLRRGAADRRHAQGRGLGAGRPGRAGDGRPLRSGRIDPAY